MSEQQSGAGYPQQPTSGQPQQQAYQAPQYASPQAQYNAQQAQQQYAAYPQQGGPSLFEKLGVPSMPAILGISGLCALALAGLIAGTSDSTRLSDYVGLEFGGVQTTLAGVMVMFALTLFAGEKLRGLWKALTFAAATMFVAEFLYVVLSLGEGGNASDASAWIGALLLVLAYAAFVVGAVLVPMSAEAAEAKAAAQQQAAAQAAQAAQQQQQAGGYGPQQGQPQTQWPQPPQQ